MGIVKRLAGPMTPSSYLAGIQTAINKYAPDLDGVRAERAAQQVARNLRTEQDSAYEISLARDRERARQRRDAEALAAAAARKEQEDAEAAELLERKRQEWRRWRATTIRPEPDAGAKDGVRLALNMPESSGAGRVIRKFDGQATMEELYAFVECYDLVQNAPDEEKASEPDDYEHKYAFRIAALMPRETFEPSEDTTIAEKMGRGGNLIVEEVGHESDDEEE